MNNANLSISPSSQENYVLQALADVRKLVFYKLSSPAHRASAEDLMQRVFCKIWAWKIRYNKVLEYDDWRKITKTIAYHEINDFFSEKYTKDVLFSQMDIDLWEEFFITQSFKNSLEGNTRAEIDSLLYSIWNAAKTLSLRQRYAFLFGSCDFLTEFINSGYCNFEELASYFDVTQDILSDIMNFIPLSDGQIGELLSARLGESVSSQQIWEARAKAKARLFRCIKQPTR